MWKGASLAFERTPKLLSLQPRRIVADGIADALARHEVTSVFGQSIPSALMLACIDRNIRQIAYRTENAGAVMADGFARIGGRVGVVAAQNGPAATLLVPGLAEALKSSIPVLALVQDIARNSVDKNAFQEFDHFALFAGCAKWVRRLPDAARIDDFVDMAIIAATSGRPGPAVILLPIDLLAEEVTTPQSRSAVLGAVPLDRSVADPASVDAAADLIANAENPVAIVGGGIHISGAQAEIAALQALASLPIGTTVMGKGAVDETDNLSLNVVGNMMGRRSAARHYHDLMQTADLVLLVATWTAQNATDTWRLLPRGARLFISTSMAARSLAL